MRFLRRGFSLFGRVHCTFQIHIFLGKLAPYELYGWWACSFTCATANVQFNPSRIARVYRYRLAASYHIVSGARILGHSASTSKRRIARKDTAESSAARFQDLAQSTDFGFHCGDRFSVEERPKQWGGHNYVLRVHWHVSPGLHRLAMIRMVNLTRAAEVSMRRNTVVMKWWGSRSHLSRCCE